MSALLEVSGLRGGYGRVEVLHGVDLAVGSGQIVALLGSNGAGKSTLNNIVCGLVPASGGTVRFDGAELTNRHYRQVVQAGLIQVPEGRRARSNPFAHGRTTSEFGRPCAFGVLSHLRARSPGTSKAPPLLEP